MNKAVVYGASEALCLLFCQRHGAHYVNAKVANASRLLQFVGGYRDLYAAVVEVAGLEILNCVKSCARSQRREQKLRGCHPTVFSPILRWLVANN